MASTADISIDVLKAFKRGVELAPYFNGEKTNDELRSERLECFHFLAERLGTGLEANVLDVEPNEQRPDVSPLLEWYDSIPKAGLLRAKLEKELFGAEKLGQL